jgi:hypothetical protein
LGKLCGLSHDLILPRLQGVRDGLNFCRLANPKDPNHDSKKSLPIPPNAGPPGLEILEICPYFLTSACSPSDCGYYHPCRNFLLGGCILKEHCRFSHDPRLLQLGETQQDPISHQPPAPEVSANGSTGQRKFLSNIPIDEKVHQSLAQQISASQGSNRSVSPLQSDPLLSTEETDGEKTNSTSLESTSTSASQPLLAPSQKCDFKLPDSSEEALFTDLHGYSRMFSIEREAKSDGGISNSPSMQPNPNTPAISPRSCDSCPELGSDSEDRYVQLTKTWEYENYIDCEFQILSMLTSNAS